MRTLLGTFLVAVVLTFALPQFGSWLNVTVMAQNNGKMPVHTFFNGNIPTSDTRHAVMTDATKYKYLCDIIPIPTTDSHIIAILSIGDIFIYSYYLMEWIVFILGGVLIIIFIRATL